MLIHAKLNNEYVVKFTKDDFPAPEWVDHPELLPEGYDGTSQDENFINLFHNYTLSSPLALGSIPPFIEGLGITHVTSLTNKNIQKYLARTPVPTETNYGAYEIFNLHKVTIHTEDRKLVSGLAQLKRFGIEPDSLDLHIKENYSDTFIHGPDMVAKIFEEGNQKALFNTIIADMITRESKNFPFPSRSAEETLDAVKEYRNYYADAFPLPSILELSNYRIALAIGNNSFNYGWNQKIDHTWAWQLATNFEEPITELIAVADKFRKNRILSFINFVKAVTSSNCKTVSEASKYVNSIPEEWLEEIYS